MKACLRSVVRIVAGAAIAAVVGTAGVAAAADETPVVERTETVKLVGVIQQINHANREVTLIDGNGNRYAFQVSEQAKHFDDLVVGDEVSATYEVSISVSVIPIRTGSGTGGSGTGRSEFARFSASAGDDGAPGGKMVGYTSIVAVVDKLDRETRMVTLRGPNRTVSVIAPPDVDLDRVNQGDQVLARVRETLVVEITPTNRPWEESVKDAFDFSREQH